MSTPAPLVHLDTPRLLLRDWSDADAEPFASLNADPRVMEFFPKALTRAESDALMARIRANFTRNRYGLYAVEEKASGRFLGFNGLAVPDFDAHFMPAVEIGWRLARTAWGSGYATEGANAVLDHAFGMLELAEVVSFTAEWNRRSRRVMEKIGMTSDRADDFDHPNVPKGHKLRRHVLYRIDRERWLSRRSAG